MTGTYQSDHADDAGIIVVDGYGVRVGVERGHLIISDGAGRERRERRLARIGHNTRRLIVLGHSGTITLEALRWMNRVGIHFSQLDSDGQLITASADRAVDDPRLRRAQALAMATPTGHGINLLLIERKLVGQTHNARTLNSDHIAERIDQARHKLQDATTEEEIRDIEAIAAFDYFSAWNEVSLNWAEKDRYRIPDQWRGFRTRRSMLTKSGNSNATDPINAILNYLYALGEIECRRACLVLGLDPGFGFLHHDAQNRDSLALDLIETIRPDIEAFVLNLADGHVFRSADFTENENGRCRILPPLTHHLAATMPRWAEAIAPWAEQVAHLIADDSPYKIRKARPLTNETRRTVGLEMSESRRRRPKGSGPTKAPSRYRALGKTCPDCGSAITDTRTYCTPCFGERRREWQTRGIAASAATLHDDNGRKARGDAVASGRQRGLQRALAETGQQSVEWDRLAPLVARLTLKQIMAATGHSISQASRVKRGKQAAHPRHWRALDETVSSAALS